MFSNSTSVTSVSARCLPVLALAFISLPVTPARAQETYSADQLVDSVGVNLHLHYDGTAYRDSFDLVKARLLELGVRHVRDGLIDTTWQGYYDRHNALGAAGIKGVFIASPDISDFVLQQYPARMASSFEGYEAPNEYNASGDPNWVAKLRHTLERLRALRNIALLAGYPLYGPSLTDEGAYVALGDISNLLDFGNLHNYFGGRPPGTSGWGDNGYGSIDWNLRLVRHFSGGRPTVTTETGYWNEPFDGPNWVPPIIAGKYMPRLVLEQFLKGVTRTYIYELFDFAQQGPNGGLTSSYGLLNIDGSPKPAFKAVRGLLSLLADAGPGFSIQPLPYSIAGAAGPGTDLRHAAFQKRDGTYYLAVWIERSGYDVNARRVLPDATQNITLNLPDHVRLTARHTWQEDGDVSRSALPGLQGSIAVTVSDFLTVFELRPATAAPAAPANVRRVGR